MRTPVQIVCGLILVLLLVIVGYYFVRKPDYRAKGQSYTLPMAAGDLVREITGGSTGPKDTSGSADNPEHVPGSPDPVPGLAPSNGPSAVVATEDDWRDGMMLYSQGRFREALPPLERALAAGRAPRGGESQDVVAMVRILVRLFEGEESGAALGGSPIALLTASGGDPFLATLVAENDLQITFRKDTMTFTVKKSKLRDSQVARTPEEKEALARNEYRRRLARIEDVRPSRAGDYLTLARFCNDYGLTDKVGYCIRQGLKGRGDVIEKELYDLWDRDNARGATARARAVRDLMNRFYPQGEHTRRAWQVARNPGVVARREPTPAPGPRAGGGIGEAVVKRPRVKDPEVEALLSKADALRREGNEHYVQTRPGEPEAAVHRKKALDAYNEAFQLYEKIQERWGVSLENTIRELLERRYQLMKMTTLK